VIQVSVGTAPELASEAVAYVERKFGFVLPYNPPSLLLVDALVDKIKETGASEKQASGLLLGLGCYVGEVFVRNTRASWRMATEMGMSGTSDFAIVLSLRGPVGCDPIGKVFARFRVGVGESVAEFYVAAVDSLG